MFFSCIFFSRSLYCFAGNLTIFDMRFYDGFVDVREEGNERIYWHDWHDVYVYDVNEEKQRIFEDASGVNFFSGSLSMRKISVFVFLFSFLASAVFL